MLNPQGFAGDPSFPYIFSGKICTFKEYKSDSYDHGKERKSGQIRHPKNTTACSDPNRYGSSPGILANRREEIAGQARNDGENSDEV